MLDSLGIKSKWGVRYSTPVQTGPGAHTASYTMGTGSFPGVKQLGRGTDHPPLPSAEGKNRVRLYIYSPFGPSWPVLGWTLLGLRQRTFCIEKLKKLQILTVPNLYVLEIMTFVIKNPDQYQTNVSISSKDTRQKLQLSLQSARLSSTQKSVCYSSITIFNKLPPHTVQLCENTMDFKNTKHFS
jgi:hypothetical protein